MQMIIRNGQMTSRTEWGQFPVYLLLTVANKVTLRSSISSAYTFNPTKDFQYVERLLLPINNVLLNPCKYRQKLFILSVKIFVFAQIELKM